MRQHNGTSLLEILISLLLLSMAIAWLDGVMLSSLRAVRNADYYLVAEQQMQILVDRILLGTRNINDLLLWWNKQNAQLLPAGKGKIDVDHHVYSISIFWGDDSMETCDHNQIGQKGCLKRNVTAMDSS